MLNTLILSGGKSSRMGTDKGLICHNGEPWVRMLYEKARSITNDVYVSVNENQVEKYSRIIDRNKLIIDDFSSVKGPLKGVLSAHKFRPACDWLVVSCDMPLISIDSLKKVKEAYLMSPGLDFYLFYKDFYEPFPGVYTSSIMRWIYNYHLVGKLEKHSMQYIHTLGFPLKIDFQNKDDNQFGNFNCFEDLKQGFSKP